jgi:hypothetical protein
MNCTAGVSAPRPPRSGGREVVAWALSCLTVCVLNALAERRTRPAQFDTLLRRPHG